MTTCNATYRGPRIIHIGRRCVLPAGHEFSDRAMQIHDFDFPSHGAVECCQRTRIIGNYEVTFSHRYTSGHHWGRYHEYSIEFFDRRTYEEPYRWGANWREWLYDKFRERLSLPPRGARGAEARRRAGARGGRKR